MQTAWPENTTNNNNEKENKKNFSQVSKMIVSSPIFFPRLSSVNVISSRYSFVIAIVWLLDSFGIFYCHRQSGREYEKNSRDSSRSLLCRAILSVEACKVVYLSCFFFRFRIVCVCLPLVLRPFLWKLCSIKLYLLLFFAVSETIWSH